ncbi:hypothetical protein ABK040_000338 [Willaertia magna]
MFQQNNYYSDNFNNYDNTFGNNYNNNNINYGNNSYNNNYNNNNYNTNRYNLSSQQQPYGGYSAYNRLYNQRLSDRTNVHNNNLNLNNKMNYISNYNKLIELPYFFNNSINNNEFIKKNIKLILSFLFFLFLFLMMNGKFIFTKVFTIVKRIFIKTNKKENELPIIDKNIIKETNRKYITNRDVDKLYDYIENLMIKHYNEEKKIKLKNNVVKNIYKYVHLFKKE